MNSVLANYVKFGLYGSSTFASLFYGIVNARPGKDVRRQQHALVPLYYACAILALGCTQYNLARFIFDQYSQYASVNEWFRNSEFFDMLAAFWVNATNDGASWWWTSQVLHFMCTFIFLSNTRPTSKKLFMVCVMWFALGGAIAVTLPLAFAQATNRPKREASTPSLVAIALCVFAAYYSIEMLPIESTSNFQHFKHYLLAMHVFALLPCLFSSQKNSEKSQNPKMGQILILIIMAAVNFLFYARNTMNVVAQSGGVNEILNFVFQKGFGSFCQSMISFDLIFCILECALFVCIEYGWPASVAFLAATPFVSFGASFPIVCLLARNLNGQERRKDE